MYEFYFYDIGIFCLSNIERKLILGLISLFQYILLNNKMIRFLKVFNFWISICFPYGGNYFGCPENKILNKMIKKKVKSVPL